MTPYGAAPFPGEGPELNLPAVIRNAGNIIKTGAGALRLGGANTFNDSPPNFSGDVFVNGGILIAAHATALGGTAGWTFVNNEGGLALLEGITITGENLVLDTSRSPALDNIAGNNIWNGPISLARDSTIAVSRDWTLQLNGVVSGAGSLTKSGAGELTLGGAANNTHAGNTFVNNGSLVLFKAPFLQAVPHDLIIPPGQHELERHKLVHGDSTTRHHRHQPRGHKRDGQQPAFFPIEAMMRFSGFDDAGEVRAFEPASHPFFA